MPSRCTHFIHSYFSVTAECTICPPPWVCIARNKNRGQVVGSAQAVRIDNSWTNSELLVGCEITTSLLNSLILRASPARPSPDCLPVPFCIHSELGVDIPTVKNGTRKRDVGRLSLLFFSPYQRWILLRLASAGAKGGAWNLVMTCNMGFEEKRKEPRHAHALKDHEIIYRNGILKSDMQLCCHNS